MRKKKVIKPAEKTKDKLRIEYLPLSELKRAPVNPKLHATQDIRESFSRFGFVAPIIMDDKTGQLVAGHGRVDSLALDKQEGKKPPERVIAKNGEWLVPVVRGVSFDDPNEATAYVLADNQLTILGGFDEKALAESLERLVYESDGAAGLLGTGYSEEALQELKDALEAANPTEVVEDDPGPLIDRAAELQKKWNTERGQIWLISKPEICPHCGEEQ